MKHYTIILTIAALIFGNFSLEAAPNRRAQARRAEQQVKNEVKEGQASMPGLQQCMGGVYHIHPEINAYVKEVFKKIVPHTNHQEMPFEIEVVNSSIPNAMTLPGGKVLITRGLIQMIESEAELAAVLSHEIHHAVAHHISKSRKQDAGASLLLTGLSILDGGLITGTVGRMMWGGIRASFSRQNEITCDLAGLSYMQRAGYDPRGMEGLQLKFLEMEKGKKTKALSGIFASHPPSKERLQKIRGKMRYLPEGGYEGKERYQNVLKPLLEKQAAYAVYEEGKGLLLSGKKREAIEKGESAVQMEPKEPLFHLLIGKAKYQLNDIEGAIESFTRGHELDPEISELLHCRARCYRKLGRHDLEREDLEKACTMMQKK